MLLTSKNTESNYKHANEDRIVNFKIETLQMITSSKIRNHKLVNSSRVHTGEVEKREYQNYRDFFSSKNACVVYELTGSGYNE